MQVLGKKMYCLTEKELSELQPQLAPNPYRVGMAPMLLYNKEQVEDLAIEKWGSMAEIVDERHRRVMRLEDRTESKITGVRRRKEELEKSLSERGLPFDEQNPLCWSYIEGDKQSLEKVVDSIEELDFLQNYTSYQQIFTEMIAQAEKAGLPFNRLELEWKAKKTALGKCLEGMDDKKWDEVVKKEEEETTKQNDLQIVCVDVEKTWVFSWKHHTQIVVEDFGGRQPLEYFWRFDRRLVYHNKQ